MTLYTDHVEITDEGSAPLAADTVEHSAAVVDPQSVGLGLYIVNLACERLGWSCESDTQAGAGRVRLWFKSDP